LVTVLTFGPALSSLIWHQHEIIGLSIEWTYLFTSFGDALAESKLGAVVSEAVAWKALHHGAKRQNDHGRKPD
jgi:hypothetical protein